MDVHARSAGCGQPDSASRITSYNVCYTKLLRLEPPTEVVGGDEVVEMPSELIVVVVVEALDGCVLDGPVHALDLTVGPWMVEPGEAMRNNFV